MFAKSSRSELGMRENRAMAGGLLALGLVGIACLGGCGTPKPRAQDLRITAQAAATGAPLQIDVLGLPETEWKTFENPSRDQLDEYFGGGSATRQRFSAYGETLQAAGGKAQTWTFAKNHQLWNKQNWINSNDPRLVIMVSGGGLNADARRHLSATLFDKEWPNGIDVQVTPAGISATAPMRK